MKVALITSSAPYGEGESFVIVEANALAEQGVDVLLIPTQLRIKTIRKIVINSKINLYSTDLFSVEVVSCFLKFFFLKPRLLLNLLYKLRGDRLVCFAKNLLVLPKAVWVAEKIVSLNVDHIHAHWASTPSTVAMVASQLSGVPWSFSAHRGDIVENNILRKKLESASFSRFIAKKSIQLIDNICPDFAGIPRLLPMGVPIPDLCQLPGKCKNRQTYVILCPANLIAVKGHRYLIEAFVSLSSQFVLWLAGSGPLEKELKETVNNLALMDQVKFLGAIEHARILEYYASSVVDVVVLPSIDLGHGIHEGIPVSLMEAMSYGVPVISTETGGIPELLKNDAGILVEPASSEQLAHNIKIVCQDRTLATQLGKNGRQRIIQQFNLDSIAHTLVCWMSEYT